MDVKKQGTNGKIQCFGILSLTESNSTHVTGNILVSIISSNIWLKIWKVMLVFDTGNIQFSAYLLHVNV